MANTKISALVDGNPAQSADVLPIDRAGSNFSITAGSIASLANVPVISTAGQGWFLGPGLTGGNLANATAGALVISGNDVTAVQFILHEVWTIRHVTYAAAVAGAGGSTISIGIYSADKSTKLLEAIFDGTNIAAQSVSVNVTLQPGVYYYAWSASTQTTLTGYTIPNFGVTTGQVWRSFLNNVAVKWGLSSNTAGSSPVPGTLPASLGTLTQSAGFTPGQNVPAAIFEP